MIDETSVTSAVPAGPKRRAAQITTGKTVYCSSPYRGAAGAVCREKTRELTATAVATRAAASHARRNGRRRPDQVRSAEATTRSPMASPSHQTDQIEP